MLVTADPGDSTIGLFRVGFGGGLQPAIGSPFTITTMPSALAFDPASSVLFATVDKQANKVHLYGLLPSGPPQLVARGSLGTGMAPKSIAFSHDGSLLVTANQFDLSLFSVDNAQQTLTTATAPSLPVTTTPTQVAFSPGSDLLAVGSTAGNVYVFSSGSAIPGSPFTAGNTQAAPAFGRAGGLLAAATEDPGNAVAVFSVGAPVAQISAPAGGAVYAAGQSVPTSFGCADAAAAPGVASCTDANGASGGAGMLDTSTTGSHIYTVTATSKDGQTSTATGSYSVALPPTITLRSPADGRVYNVNDRAVASYRCQEGTGGPGIQSCTGTIRDGVPLPTRAHKYSFTVTATSQDGLTATQTVSYEVSVQPPSPLTTTITPTEAGTAKSPTPIGAEFRWQLRGNGSSQSQYTLTLPADIITQPKQFVGCDRDRVSGGKLPKTCSDAVIGRGSVEALVIDALNHSNQVRTCKYTLEPVALHPSALGLGLLVGPATPHHRGCPQQTVYEPVRVTKFTGSGLTVLSFMLPGTVVGGPSSVNQAALEFQLSKNKTRGYLASTGCPPLPGGKGFAWTTVLELGTPPHVGSLTPTSTTTCTVAGTQPVTAAKGNASTVDGIVVHQIPRAHSFVVVRSDGQLFTIATPSALPAIGTQLTVGVRPLSYGMWAQTCLTLQSGTATQAALKGVVTFVGPQHHAFVLTGGGTSILLEHPKGIKLPPLLHVVTVQVAIVGGKLVEQGIHVGRAYKGRLVLSGILKRVLKDKLGKQLVSVTTDDSGSKLGGEFELKLPSGRGALGKLSGHDAELVLIEDVSGNPKSLFTHKPMLALAGFNDFALDAGKLCGG
jgi:hypothetical protein